MSSKDLFWLPSKICEQALQFFWLQFFEELDKKSIEIDVRIIFVFVFSLLVAATATTRICAEKGVNQQGTDLYNEKKPWKPFCREQIIDDDNLFN